MENEFTEQENVSSPQEQNAFREPASQPVKTPEVPQQPPVYNPYFNTARFDPEPRYQQVHQNLYGQEYTAKPAKPPKVKKVRSGKVWKGILSIFLIVVLAFGCSGLGAYLGIQYMERQNTEETKTEQKAPAQNTGGSATVLEGDRQNTQIQIDQIDTGKQMTPAEIYALNVNSTVGITTSISTNYFGYTTTSAATGSGFVYSKEGYIITNYHVIEDSSSISVSLYDGTALDAKLIGYDASNDVAVLKVDHEGLVPVVIGNSSQMHVGDSVLAIGNPLGELTFSLTAGTVSALNREVTFSDGMTMNLIQTDCAINSGNSGGALFNLYGEVVGITNAKYSGNSSSGASIDNIGFAIPMNEVRSIIDSIIETGYVVKPYIGVTIVDVSQEALDYGLPAGASIRSIETDSPAEKAGLKKNDIVTGINGTEITSSADLKRIVSESKPGDVLKCTVWRKNAELTIEITVGEQTQDVSAQQGQQQSQQQQPSIQIPGYPGYDWGY